jgi:hypothetical protein
MQYFLKLEFCKYSIHFCLLRSYWLYNVVKYMKKFFPRLAVGIAALLAIPIVLYIVITAIKFASFYITLARTSANSCNRYYEGVSKGTIWNRGEWHHYVDFKVDASAPREQWEVVKAPLPSGLWREYSPLPNVVRAGYRWPSNWRDPFPVNFWGICLLSS